MSIFTKLTNVVNNVLDDIIQEQEITKVQKQREYKVQLALKKEATKARIAYLKGLTEQDIKNIIANEATK